MVFVFECIKFNDFTILWKCSVSCLFGMNFWKIDRKLYFNHPILVIRSSLVLLNYDVWDFNWNVCEDIYLFCSILLHFRLGYILFQERSWLYLLVYFFTNLDGICLVDWIDSNDRLISVRSMKGNCPTNLRRLILYRHLLV